MTCERSRSSLRDHALGLANDPTLAAHLETCPRCRTLLEQDRRLTLELDAATRDLLRTSPSDALATRIRLRLADAAREESGGSVGWLNWLTVPVHVPRAALIGLVALLLLTTALLVVRPPAAPEGAQPTEAVLPARGGPAVPHGRLPVVTQRSLEGFRPVSKIVMTPLEEEL